MKRESVIENGVAMLLGTCANILLSIITTPIITRIVAPHDYGEWSLLTTYTNVMMAIVLMGLDQAFVRFYYKDNSVLYKKYLTYTVVKIPILLSASLIVISLGFIRSLKLFDGDSWVGYIMLYANLLIAVVNRIAQLVLRMEQKGKAYSMLLVVNKFIYVLVVFALVLATSLRDFVALTLGTLVSQVVVVIVAIYLCRGVWFAKKQEKCSYELNKRAMIVYGLPFIYSSLAGDVFNYADKWAIKSIQSYSDVGIYSAAANVVSICAIVQTTFSLLWAPMAMEHYEKAPENKAFFEKANSCITLAMFAIGAFVVCFKDVIVYLLGEEYRLAATVIPFLLFNPIMTTISETTVYGVNFRNKTWYHAIITTIPAILNIVLNMILVPVFSSKGAAIATAISYVVFYALRTVLGQRCYSYNISHLKFGVVCVAFFGYAAVNTFLQVGFMMNAVLCILFMILLLTFYGKYAIDLVKMMKVELSNRRLISKKDEYGNL